MFPILSFFVMEKMYKFNLNLIKIENQLMCSYNKAFSRENSYSLPWNSNSINIPFFEKNQQVKIIKRDEKAKERNIIKLHARNIKKYPFHLYWTRNLLYFI